MNAAIRNSRKRIESLYLLTDESRKVLALGKVRFDSLPFISELTRGLKDLEGILEREYNRLSGLTRSMSKT